MAFAPDETADLTPVDREISQPLPIPGDPDEWFVGAVIDDRYELQRRLGHGAMGDVYLASDRLLKKYVALKALRAELAQQVEVLRRFRREVALAHSVTHPAVVRIYDTGEAHGLPYFTMEYLRGQTLEDLLGELADGAPPMSVREIRETSHEILQGLQAAHEAGVIHRDLKPANVMLTRRGAIVMDFGVAGFGNLPQLASAPDAIELGDALVQTAAGTIFGSPAYMAPELWDGESATVQTDLYAFGVLMYQMLTGQLPFTAPNASAFLAKLRDGKYPPVRSVRRDTPLAIATLVGRCMSHDVDQRPRSAEEAAHLIAPAYRRRRIALALAGLGLTGGVFGYTLTESDDWSELGLPDAVALHDLGAAVRSYDAGAHGEALDMLDRLDHRAPRSAAVAFWRATVHHEVGADTHRRETCPRGELRGSEEWAEAAAAACGRAYELSPLLLESLEGRGPFPTEYVPLGVLHSMVPNLEGSRDPSQGSLARARLVLRRLEAEPRWSDADVVVPVRWQLARAELMVALGDVSGAAGVVDELLESYRGAPAALAYGAWLSTQLGRRSRARQLAADAVNVDPRPEVRLMLDAGRLEASAAHVDSAQGTPLHAPLLEMWCGYAFRYELATMPARCEALSPGLVHAMWAGGSTERDLAAMTPAELEIINRQIELNRGTCLDRAPTVSLLQHAAPPFSTYIRQLEVSAALCPMQPAAGDPTLAKRLAQSLLEHDEADPWARLLEAQVDEIVGDRPTAERQRRQVADAWGAADTGLPLVSRLRALVEPPRPKRVAPTPSDVPPPSPASPDGDETGDGDDTDGLPDTVGTADTIDTADTADAIDSTADDGSATSGSVDDVDDLDDLDDPGPPPVPLPAEGLTGETRAASDPSTP